MTYPMPLALAITRRWRATWRQNCLPKLARPRANEAPAPKHHPLPGLHLWRLLARPLRRRGDAGAVAAGLGAGAYGQKAWRDDGDGGAAGEGEAGRQEGVMPGLTYPEREAVEAERRRRRNEYARAHPRQRGQQRS